MEGAVSCAYAGVGWKSECGEAAEQPGDPRSFLVDRSRWFSGFCTMMKYIIYIIYIRAFFTFKFLFGTSLQFLLSIFLDLEVTRSAKNLLEV
jgi:hypothetical protein